MSLTVLHTPLNGGVYVSVRFGSSFIDLEAIPTAGCARIVTWRLPIDDDRVTDTLIECATKQANRYKGMVRILVPTIDLSFIKALHRAGYTVSVLQQRGRMVELTRRFV